MSRFFDAFQFNSIIFESNICSLLSIGSAFNPIKPNKLVIVVFILSLRSSSSLIIYIFGASKERKIDIGNPA